MPKDTSSKALAKQDLLPYAYSKAGGRGGGRKRASGGSAPAAAAEEDGAEQERHQQAEVGACIGARVCMDACMHACVCVHACMRACVRACVHVCVRACICACMCAYVRARVRVCVLMQACMQVQVCSGPLHTNEQALHHRAAVAQLLTSALGWAGSEGAVPEGAQGLLDCKACAWRPKACGAHMHAFGCGRAHLGRYFPIPSFRPGRGGGGGAARPARPVRLAGE